MFVNHEQGVVGLLDVKEGDVFIDVGANLGSVSLYAVNNIGNGVILAIEPVLHNYLCLCFNTFAYPQIRTLQCAVGDRNDFLKINISKYSGWSSFKNLTFLNNHGNRNREFTRQETVPVFTLDYLMKHYQLEKVDWLKIDTEGYEVETLKGGIDLIRRFRPKILLEVHATEDGDSIEKMFNEWDYVFFKQFDPLNKAKEENYHILAEPVENQNLVPLMNFEKTKLISKTWIYRKIGEGERQINFAGNSEIENPAPEDWEKGWQVYKVKDEMHLILTTDKVHLCHLQKNSDQHWSGNWLYYDKTPVELIGHE